VGEAASAGGCSTSVVRALSEQLIEEIQCLSPGAMARIDDIGELIAAHGLAVADIGALIARLEGADA
jgi:hypothetical protein